MHQTLSRIVSSIVAIWKVAAFPGLLLRPLVRFGVRRILLDEHPVLLLASSIERSRRDLYEAENALRLAETSEHAAEVQAAIDAIKENGATPDVAKQRLADPAIACLLTETRIAVVDEKITGVSQNGGQRTTQELVTIADLNHAASKCYGSTSLQRQTAYSLGYRLSSAYRLSEAAEAFDESVNIARKLGEHALVGLGLSALGGIRFDQGETEAALRSHEEALVEYRTASVMGETLALLALGEIHLSRGELETAGGRFREAIASAKKLGQQAEEAEGLAQLASVQFLRADVANAITRLKEATAVCKGCDPLGTGKGRAFLGREC